MYFEGVLNFEKLIQPTTQQYVLSGQESMVFLLISVLSIQPSQAGCQVRSSNKDKSCKSKNYIKAQD